MKTKDIHGLGNFIGIVLGATILLLIGINYHTTIQDSWWIHQAVVDTIIIYDTIHIEVQREIIDTIHKEVITTGDNHTIPVEKEDTWEERQNRWERKRLKDTIKTSLAVHTIEFEDTVIAHTNKGDIIIYSISKK